jgi:hypothetical protein
MSITTHYRARNKGSLRPAAIFLVLAACTLVTHAQVEDSAEPLATTPTTPHAELQYSTLTGSGNTLTATMLPIITAGAVVYKDVTLQFNIDASGNITVASGYPKTIGSPPIQASSFEAGTYVGPSTVLSGEALISVSSPGVTAGGATEWTLATTSGASGCTYPASATWYVGPLASNPLAARLKAKSITSTAYSYGIIGSTSCVPNGYWDSGGIVGVSQTGNKLAIVSFSAGTYEDYSTPRDQITYTLK